MPRADDCTCPPDTARTYREGVGTREPCPVHPEPDLSGVTFLPAMRGPFNLEPFSTEEVDDAAG